MKCRKLKRAHKNSRKFILKAKGNARAARRSSWDKSLKRGRAFLSRQVDHFNRLAKEYMNAGWANFRETATRAVWETAMGSYLASHGRGSDLSRPIDQLINPISSLTE
jgi:hypothetical protein